VYGVDDAREFLATQSAEVQSLAQEVDGKFVSGFVRAVKPAINAAPALSESRAAAAACCAPACCAGK
jgi:hypothetical protein